MTAPPPLADLTEGARVVRLPLVTRFRGITEREMLLVEGPQGWAEFSPFVEYDDEESANWLAAAIDAGWHAPPPAHRAAVAVNATVPDVEPERIAAVLARFAGCTTAKVKVAGGPLERDVRRVAAVREVLGPEGVIRVDANGAWSLEEARRAAEALAPFHLDYLEQPCATVEELAALRAGGPGVRIAADESIRRASDPLRVAELEAADVMIVKLQPLGGARRVLDLIAATGLPAVVSSALESSVGLAAGVRLAAALPVERAAGLGTAALLAGDVTGDPLLPANGALPVRGVEPESALLDRWAVTQERRAWWLHRLERCYRWLVDDGQNS